jgi:N-acetylmuramic acid 6-phosphate etherase
VKDNKMIDMQLTNHKLIARGTNMVMEETGLRETEAKSRLMAAGSVRKAVDQWRSEQ